MKALITLAAAVLFLMSGAANAYDYRYNQREQLYQLESIANDTRRTRELQEREDWDRRVAESNARREAREREREREQLEHCRRYPRGLDC